MSINFLSFLVKYLFFFNSPNQEMLHKAKIIESQSINPQQRSSLNADYA